MNEPAPPDPDWPRYSSRPFPPYRFLPGLAPHPRRDPSGHSYGQPEPAPPAFLPEDWWDSEWYLYGVDLYNFAYWWECHEVFEALWHAVGHKSEQGQFLQALIQIAAANIKKFLDAPQAVANLTGSGLTRFEKLPPSYMGVDVAAFTRDVRAYFGGAREKAPLIRLVWPETSADL